MMCLCEQLFTIESYISGDDITKQIWPTRVDSGESDCTFVDSMVPLADIFLIRPFYFPEGNISPHFPQRQSIFAYHCCSFLDEVGTSCEAASEFLALYKKLFAKDHWKYYLAVKGVPARIATLITKVSAVSCTADGNSWEFFSNRNSRNETKLLPVRSCLKV